MAEVASVGGFQRQYQVNIDPEKLRAHQVTLAQVSNAVRKSNRETGARNLAINGVEYFLRGTGYIKSTRDLEQAVVAVRDHTPVIVSDVAEVQLGPALRRGALDVNGADAVGGVVVARYGSNPLQAIKNTKARIAELENSLPAKALIDWEKTTPSAVEAAASQHGIENTPAAWLAFAQATPRSQWPAWLTTSKVTIVPFYDRSALIGETLHTLDQALSQQVLVTIIVVIAMVLHLRASLLISSMLPLAVLITFIAMKLAGVDANIVALAGIAIAIGTVVDVGIVLTENILKRLDEAGPSESRAGVIHRAVTEVAGAVATSVATTVVSFLPVFTLTGEAGRLFRPLAFTKTFALIASLVVALAIIPPAAHLLFGVFPRWLRSRRALPSALLLAAALFAIPLSGWLAAALALLAAALFLHPLLAGKATRPLRHGLLALNLLLALLVAWLLALDWMPLGLDRPTLSNLLFVVLLAGAALLLFRLFEFAYPALLRWCLAHKAAFLTLPALLLLLSAAIWFGVPRLLSLLPESAARSLSQTRLGQDAAAKFPGLGREFRPALDEGSFLYMPTVAPHASIDEALAALRLSDAAIAAIPEVSRVVGKIGRAETPLDPAPISMIETVINYIPEFKSDEKGQPLRFKTDGQGNFLYKNENLIPHKNGKPFRQWRPHIRTPDDIWAEIDRATRIPGLTGAPKLQPIETRLVMLRTGMRAPIGIKVKGSSLQQIETFGLHLEKILRDGSVPGLDPATVNADRIVGKPYLEIVPDRATASRYGLNIADIHETIQTAIGGKIAATTIEGRERYRVQVRFAREDRDTIETLRKVIISSSNGTPVPLTQLADIRYVRGPQVIKAEDTFLTGYLTFGALPGHAEINVVEAAKARLEAAEQSGALARPPGLRYEFAGNYQAALESNRTLMVAVPLCLAVIFIILYLQNRSVLTTLIVFSGVAVATSGGFLLLWLYGQPGFLDIDLFGRNLARLFNVAPVNLSVAVAVGFIALFGIATDDGVVISTYLRQKFAELRPQSANEIRSATLQAGLRRVRPCLMTTATTLLALLPVLTSSGRGSDLMIPMALPIFGGMLVEFMTMFVVPVLYCATQEHLLKPQRSVRSNLEPRPE